MARLPRLVVPNQPHYLIQRGAHQQAVFLEPDDYRAFLQWLREASKLFKVALHAYVLMPDHVRFLATPADESGLSKMMQWLGRYYVPYFNHKYHRAGTLWQGRYRASVIDAECYLLACCQHIEQFPVAAGAVADPVEYPWSSCAYHLGVRPDPLVTDHPAYWALGNTPFQREIAYRQLLEQPLPARDAQALTEAAEKGWALGSEGYKALLEKAANRRVSPARRGRRRKTESVKTGAR